MAAVLVWFCGLNPPATTTTLPTAAIVPALCFVAVGIGGKSTSSVGSDSFFQTGLEPERSTEKSFALETMYTRDDTETAAAEYAPASSEKLQR